MESRHDLSVDHARLLNGGYMDPQTAGQMRPPYGELCRPPGADASSLSAYHSRYLASMPLSTSSSFPFLGGMFTGSLPGPPTSPFRTPTTPGVNNMRQFWPPTPPPDGGYGRYSMNTNLFPLFGAPSPDNGAFLTQGLVSRLGSTTHLSPLIDHKEHSFFSHGIGLGSPLTPTSHVASPSPFPHLIPSLERHPAYGGHMTLGNKELEELQQEAEDNRLMKSHYDCLMKHDIPSSRQDRPKSKNDRKHCCDKANEDCCKLSPTCISHDNGKSHDDIRNNTKLENRNHNRHPTNKVQPCKIEVSHSPALKSDLLSPPIESPKSDSTSPSRNSKKQAHSPFVTDSVPLVPTSAVSYEENRQTRCSQCCANITDVGVATKTDTSESKKLTALVPAQTLCNPIVPQKSQTPVTSSSSIPVSTTTCMGTSDNSQETAESVEGNPCLENPSSSSPVITVTSVTDKPPSDQSSCKSNKTHLESPSSKLSNHNTTLKHVTAAVIPTAPKQTVHRDIHPETNCSTMNPDHSKDIANSEQSVLRDQNKFCTDNHVKLELVESSSSTEKTSVQNNFQGSTNNSFSSRPFIKNPSTSCKVKDIIKNTCSAKQILNENFQDTSPSKNSEHDSNKIPSNSPIPSSKVIPSSEVTTTVSPTVMSKSSCKNGKIQYVPLENINKCSPFKEDIPIMKSEAVSSRLDCEFSQKPNSSWTKATVSPFNWQANNSQDEQAINLTVSKKIVKPEPNETIAVAQMQDIQQTNIKIATENTIASTGVIGVCHPNPSPIAINKIKPAPALSSISNFASISVLNQPTEQSTEVHILHRSSKSSFPMVNRNGSSPVPLKSTISHVTANTSIHRSLKTERLTAKRGKISEMDKINHSGRTTLATLAPKLSKSMNFGKDVQTSHTISASSSVSSTSIVFPATVNPCIPVGIAIAQQRQDSSTAALGKSQSSVPSSTPSVLSSNSHISANRVPADLQTQEILRDHKGQDLPLSSNPTPVDTNLLVTQGPTIVSRQWESEALTRTALPSSWVAHGSIVAPAVWLGQGAYTATAAPASNTVPSVAINSLESSPISLPPGGYQLARDSITGHLLLIPTANIELMDRPSVWPTFNSSAGNLPIQQLVTQQQHTQFEQVLPQTDSLKSSDGIDSHCNITTCDISSNTSMKTEEKIEDVSGQVPSVPLATGQTYAFTTFPTQCDPSGFSYVLQSSTVMHLAHTQTTASIQTESGRRSQATSPLHCATPSPPPNTCSVQVSVTEDEEESDNESDTECCETTQIQMSNQSQSVTTAIQVDMDSQTNSEEDEDEDRKMTEKPDTIKVEMSDSANQTESVPSESPKSEPDMEDIEIPSEKADLKEASNHPSPPKIESDVVSTISIKEDIVSVEPGLEIVTSETELAPSLPVESQPVIDFIDHHGLNLLVDSIEEFASREQEAHQGEDDEKQSDSVLVRPLDAKLKIIPEPAKVPELCPAKETANILPQKSYSPPYKTIDTTCTDGLGLLCALAEQRFFEEALNDDSKTKTGEMEVINTYSFEDSDANVPSQYSSVKEDSCQSNSHDISSESSLSSSPSHREATEMEMRLQIEELQKKYKQKQRELELLRNKKDKDDEEIYSISTPTKSKKVVASTKSSVPCPKSPVGFGSPNISKHLESSQKLQFPVTECSKSDSNNKENTLSKNKINVEKMDESTKPDDPNQGIQSAISAHDSASSHPGDSASNSSDSSSGFSERSSNLNGNSKADKSVERKGEDQDYDKNDKSKTPFFDEQAWFVRRSERIFLSDARTTSVPVAATITDKSKKQTTHSANKVPLEPGKEKKEHAIKQKGSKSSDDMDSKKNKNKMSKPKLSLPKKRSLSLSSNSDDSSDEESSEVESSDTASSTSENLPLSTFVDTPNKAILTDRQKRLSTDSEYSSGQSEDLPLSVLLENKIPELKSCILKPDDLQENARLLVLDEGLFYAGYITKSEDPDLYGILIDGDRAARPHIFSKEEILNAAVLEVKPTHKNQLPEGSRICAFWSQQYRCLYPGTVTKASNPLPDPSMLYVEFDDGDSGRIPLNDIRMLPSDFPIVSMEPNPFMILGKRRSRAQSQNNNNGNSDPKSVNEPNILKHDKDKSEHKKCKNPDKANKKSHVDGKICKDKPKSTSKSPSATNRSRSSSKSSSNGRGDGKSQNIGVSKEPNEESKKKLESKSKHADKKSKENDDLDKSILKPKKHKKHKEDHHKHHHHHHHKHHHHKKHKTERSHSSDETVIHSSKVSGRKSLSNSLSSSTMKSSEQEHDTFILENSKTDLTFKIKKSPSPHTSHEEPSPPSGKSNVQKKGNADVNSESSSDEEIEPPKKKVKKAKQQLTQNKPSKRKERVPSVEKSKIAAFLPNRQLWRWSGKSYKKPGAKGKAKKEFYRAIQRGKESIRVGDCAVFLSTGRPHLPYIGRIETMWESWGGKMDVKVKWFYHPEETKSGKKLSQLKGALFQSPHFDENDVQTISHKCEVLSWGEFQEKTLPENMEDNNDTYFLAGTYDPIMGTLILEPGVPNIISDP